MQRASGNGRLADDHVDARIAISLEEASFHSVHFLAFATTCPRSTICRHLHTAGFVLHNAYLVPHNLSLAQKAKSVTTTIELKKGCNRRNIEIGGVS
jgi:hypothetical protein